MLSCERGHRRVFPLLHRLGHPEAEQPLAVRPDALLIQVRQDVRVHVPRQSEEGGTVSRHWPGGSPDAV
jgi:hypothetical protein